MKLFMNGEEIPITGDVKVIYENGEVADDFEQHITLNDDGIAVDMVKDGEVKDSRWFLHEDLFPASFDDDEWPSSHVEGCPGRFGGPCDMGCNESERSEHDD